MTDTGEVGEMGNVVVRVEGRVLDEAEISRDTYRRSSANNIAHWELKMRPRIAPGELFDFLNTSGWRGPGVNTVVARTLFTSLSPQTASLGNTLRTSSKVQSNVEPLEDGGGTFLEVNHSKSSRKVWWQGTGTVKSDAVVRSTGLDNSFQPCRCRYEDLPGLVQACRLPPPRL